MKKPTFFLCVVIYATLLCFIASNGTAQKGPDPNKAVTVKEPSIPPDSLVFLLIPLTRAELENEVLGWQALLKKAVANYAEAQLKLHKIAILEQAQADNEDPPPEALLGPKVEINEKEELAKKAGELMAERSGLLSRFDIVLKEFEKKGGDPAPYLLYAKAVSAVKVNWTDPHSYWKTLRSWALSDEGGIAWLKRIGFFCAVVFGAYIVGIVVSWILAILFRLSGTGSKLMHQFVVKWSKRGIFLIGILMGLSALGLNITPLIATLGATGFVIGMALQNTLSNFASGILIMTQRPFDMGDAVEVAGVSGKVDKVGLFDTHITTFDNSKLRVPNNAVWSNVITNTTAADIKRLDLSFDVKPTVSVEEAEEELLKTVSEHPKVLEEPPPIVRMDELTEDGYKIICWPWVKTVDSNEVRWDIVRKAQSKLRLAPSEESA